MAEEILIAELRAGFAKFEADIRKAQAVADKQSAAIQKSLDGVESAVRDLPAAFHEFNKSLRKTEQATRQTERAMSRMDGAMQTVKNTLGSLGLLFGVREMIRFATSTIQASDALTAVESQLTHFSGSAEIAERQMAAIREQTERFGQSTVVAAQSFAQMSAAAENTALEGAGVEHIFRALNTVAAATRMSTEKYGNVLNQVSQIMAKGRFQGEELTTMAENGIPAFSMLAQAMGKTGEELADMMQKGQVSSDNLILLADRWLESYSKIADQAATTVPAKFRQGVVKIQNYFIDLAEEILSSSELINAITIQPDMSDMIPSVQTVANEINELIGEIARLVAIAQTLFQGLKKFITNAFTSIATEIEKAIEPVFEWWDEQVGKIPVAAIRDRLTFGFKAARERAEAETRMMTENIGATIEDFAESTELQKILGDIFGNENPDLRRALDNINKQLRKAFDLPPNVVTHAPTAKAETSKATDAISAELEERRKKIAAKNKAIGDDTKATAESVEKDIAAMRKRVRKDEIREEIKAIEEAKKRRLDAANELRELLAKNEERIAKEAAKAAEMANEAIITGIPILDADKFREAQREIEETTENMKRNIQEAFGDILTKAFRGQIDDVKDVFNIIADLAATTAAEMASAFVIDPLINKLQAGLQKQLFSIGGQGVTGGGIVGAGLGGMAGGAIGSGIGGALGGKPGSILGGVGGGALGGALAGSILPGIGTAVGAAVGAIVGGITSAIQAGVFKSTSKTTIGINTSPTSTGGPSRMSPFGVLNMFEEASGNEDVINAALTFIAETDTAIARYLTETQRAVVEQYVNAGIPEGNLVRAEEMDDAIAKAVALRYYHIITAIAGQDVATNVIGSPFGATAGDIGQIQQRAVQALELLKTIEEFQVGPITDTAAAIKAINAEFQALIDRATSFGIPTDDILAEQQRQLAEITTNFNQDIATSILAIKDPVAAQFAELEREQEERRKNAVDAEANLTELTELETLEREELAKRLGQASAGAAVSTDLLTQRLEAFQNQGLSAAGQQLLTLKTQFEELRVEMAAAGMSTVELTATYQQQATAIRHQAQQQVLGALYGITNPFQAAMLNMAQQVREFQKLVAEGIVPQSTVNQFISAATNQARYQEAMRLAGGGAVTAAGQFQQMVDAFTANTRPLSNTEQEIQRITAEFEQLAAALAFLGVPTANLEAHRDAQIAAVREQEAAAQREAARQLAEERQRQAEERRREAEARREEAERKRQEARQKAEQRRQEIDQYQQGRTQFLNAARSSARQQLESLARSYKDLVAEGRRLGQSTDGLSRSYRLQVAEIRRVARESVQSAIYGITDPFKASMLQIAQQVREFQQLAADGLVPRGEVERYRRVATAQARRERAERQRDEADRRISGRESLQSAILGITNPFKASMLEISKQVREFQKLASEGIVTRKEVERYRRVATAEARREEAERRTTARESVLSAVYQMTDPFRAGIMQITQQVREFRKIADEGLIPHSTVSRFQRLSLGNAAIDQALALIGGGPQSGVKSIADAFSEFIGAGSPLADSVQRMSDLTEQFKDLASGARYLGLSTKALEKSYIAQAKVIREETIEAIDQELAARKKTVTDVGDYIRNLKLGQENPMQMRFDEAREQFLEAARTGSLEDALGKAEQYRGIAQERFGTTPGYFAFRGEIERILGQLKDREQYRIEQERNRLIAQQEREMMMVANGRTTISLLQQNNREANNTSRGIAELIASARRQESLSQQTSSYLRRVVDKVRA